MIGARVKIVVVSLGADGAVGVHRRPRRRGRRLRRRPVDRHHRRGRPVRRRLGVGRRGRASRVDDALRWAALYAALSVRVPTGAGGATHLERVPRGRRAPRPAGPAARAASGSPEATRARDASVAPAVAAGVVVQRASRLAASCGLVLVAGCGGVRRAAAARPAPTPRHRRRRTAAPAAPALCEDLTVRKVGHGRRARRDRALRARRCRGPGTLWTHNDSGDAPRVFALDRRGRLLREVAVSGAEAVDWEDIAIRGRTLYVGDIGDNLAQRPNVAVYRFAEPPPGRHERRRERIDLRYADGAARRRDAARRPAQRHDRRSSPRTSAAAPASTSPRKGVLRKRATLQARHRPAAHRRRRLRRRPHDRPAQLRPRVRLRRAAPASRSPARSSAPRAPRTPT